MRLDICKEQVGKFMARGHRFDLALDIQRTVLEFDFVPLQISSALDYIFASNEYQDDYPCLYSDGFAFFNKRKITRDYKTGSTTR
jgi:hypothetical protein